MKYLPDVNNRTKDNPCVLVGSRDVLKIYNHAHNYMYSDHFDTDPNKVMHWFLTRAVELG